MARSNLVVDSAVAPTLALTAVIPVMNGAVTGDGEATAGMVTLTDLSAYFVGIDGPFFMNTATATPSAYVATSFIGFSSTISGASIMGYGSTNDVTLMNRAGTVVLGVTANTTGVVLAGALAITGALSGVTTAAISTSATVTSASAVALAVGLAGATNPSFVVDSSTGSQAAGLKVTGATAAGNVAVAVISSGAAANLLLDAKGTGTIGIGSVSTGAVTITPATQVVGAFGCNNATPQTAATIGAALNAYATGVFGLDSDANMSALHADVVAMRAALVANGILVA